MKTLRIIIKELINSRVKTRDGLAMVKRKIAKKYKTPFPSNIVLLKTYHELVKNKSIKASKTIENLLVTRPIRSLSGIVNVSVLTKPYACPGRCIYCPTEKDVPKSYLSNEPAVMRAILNKYDPYKQVEMRIRALKSTGHPTDKIDLRTIGGTWSFYPKKYQIWFIKRCFDACNKRNSKTLEQAQNLNETAKHRIVGLSIETRPDFVNEKEIKNLRNLGVTRVELGVESVYDDVLKLIKRGHGVKEIFKATKLLKDAGFKICYQIMPNLPGSNLKRDEKMFKILFSNSDLQPDLLKIYTCAVIKNTPLYGLWKKKKYKTYSDKQLTNLIKTIKMMIPYYVRIQRITRDIPAKSIVAGPAKISNLRQILSIQSKICKCIRCRQVKENYDPKEKIMLFRQDYKASCGKEVFLSFENKKRTKLYSLLRLRLTSQDKVIIRELHTYGQQIPLSQTSIVSAQHKGFGKKLVKEAEKIAKNEFKANEIYVISGIGARGYYKKIGYRLKNTYMIKRI